jgi:Fe(3+) dicitrate transport protein
MNLLGTCTASTGGGCVIGDQFDGGEVDVYGLEATFGTDLAQAFGADLEVPFSATYTLTQSEFKSAFNSGFDPWGDVAEGDELPYVADHQLFLTLGVEGARWGGEFAMLYQSERRTVAGQGPIAADERLDPHTVFDFAGHLELFDGVRVIGKVENMFNETYVAAARPAGLRPGLPRTFWVGVDAAF